MKRITAIIVLTAMLISCFAATSVMASHGYGVDNLNNNKGNLYVGFLGGSITQGSGASLPNNRYASLVTKEFFGEKFPSKTVVEINAAVGGTGSSYGLMRMKTDLKLGTEQSPDVVFVEYAVNDAGAPNNAGRVKNMESIVRQLISQPKIPAIVFIYTFSNRSVHLNGTSDNSIENAIADFHKVAENYGIYEINLTEYIGQQVDSGKLDWSTLSSDAVHPNDRGYRIYADYIKECLEKDYNKAFTKIDPQTKPCGEELFGVMEQIPFSDDRIVKSEHWVHKDRGMNADNCFHDGYYENEDALEATFEMEFEGTGVGINMARNFNNAYLNWTIINKTTGETVETWTIKSSFNMKGESGVGFWFKTGMPKDTYIVKCKLEESETSQGYGGSGKNLMVNSLVIEKDPHDNLPGLVSGTETGEQTPTDTEGTENIPSDTANNGVVINSGNRTILYVAKDGNDSNSGTINAPFASVEKARDTLRALKKAGTLGEDGAVVYVREGDYLVTETIEFTKEDAGTEEAPIVYRAYPGENVSLLGGASIPWENFKKVSDSKILGRLSDASVKEKLYQVDLFALGYTSLPELPYPGTYSYAEGMLQVYQGKAPSGDVAAPELIINGRAMTIARYPNNSQLHITKVIQAGATPRNWEKDTVNNETHVPEDKRVPTPFIIEIGEEVGKSDPRVANWSEAKDALITGSFAHAWASQTVPIANVNGSVITSKYPSQYSVFEHSDKYHTALHVYNLLEEIDIPGEYYVDRQSGIMYLYPPDETIETVIYTSLETPIVEFKETEYIELKGIDLKYTRGTAAQITDSSNCIISDAEITYTGAEAVKISGTYSSNNIVKDCYIHDVDGGVVIAGCGDRETLTPANNVIENCEFENCDRIGKTYNPAINLDQGVGNIAIYNKIHGAVHTLILFRGNDHLIAFNEIYDGCTDADDSGAIYRGRDLTARGNRILYNYFHDIGGAAKGTIGCHAIYLDDYLSWVEVTGNVFENIESSAVAGNGSHNKVNNNILINVGWHNGIGINFGRMWNPGSEEAKNMEAGFQQTLDMVPYKSEVWLERYPEIANVIDEYGNYDVSNDLVATNNVLINCEEAVRVSVSARPTAVVENNMSYNTDPGFYDFYGGNYLLKQDSRVYSDIEGFKVVPFTRMGMYSERALNRIKDAYAYSLDTPYAYKKGELVNAGKFELIAENGGYYMPLRSLTEIEEGEITYNEETEEISVITDSLMMTFTDGAEDKVLVNGSEHTLKMPIVNKNYTNYISLEDIISVFGKEVINKDGVVIISDIEALFTDEVDDNLLRYIKDNLSVY